MKTNDTSAGQPDVNRRDFLKGTSVAAMMAMMGGVELKAQEAKAAGADEKEVGDPVKCGVIGLGSWGREMVNTLAQLKEAEVTAVCDPYPASLRRGSAAAPKAMGTDDYRKILDHKEIKAVLVATPTHLHREIVEAALQAGKHVYCEAPLAHTIEDARAIALAAKAAKKQVFQSGHQMRSDPQRHFLLPFIRSGAMGKTVMARAQWHKKTSWRFPSPNPEREKELNWRLRKDISPGLIGEIGIQQIDIVSWILNAQPVSVTGFGGVLFWNDGREVPDTIQAVFEFPGGVNFIYHCTLANSFDADYEMYYGSDAAVLIRENKAWMFKEVDSPLLGWEVYARKDTFYKETGIALVANATKIRAQGDKPVEEAPYTSTPLYYGLEAFLSNVNDTSDAVEDFTSNFGSSDDKALAAQLGALKLQPAAGYKEGYEATVMALKANEAITKGQKVKFEKEWFQLG